MMLSSESLRDIKRGCVADYALHSIFPINLFDNAIMAIILLMVDTVIPRLIDIAGDQDKMLS